MQPDLNCQIGVKGVVHGGGVDRGGFGTWQFNILIINYLRRAVDKSKSKGLLKWNTITFKY